MLLELRTRPINRLYIYITWERGIAPPPCTLIVTGHFPHLLGNLVRSSMHISHMHNRPFLGGYTRMLSGCLPVFYPFATLYLSVSYPFAIPSFFYPFLSCFYHFAILSRILFLQWKESICSCNSKMIPQFLFLFLVQLSRLGSCSCRGRQVFVLVTAFQYLGYCSWCS